jgi:hypothetical protein
MKKIYAEFLYDVPMPLMSSIFGAHGGKMSFCLCHSGMHAYLLHDFFEDDEPPFFCSDYLKMKDLAVQVFQQIMSILEAISKDHKSRMTEIFIDGEKLVLFLRHQTLRILKHITHHIFIQPVSF